MSKADPPPLVSLRNVALRSADRVYFSGLDWDIGVGEHWAILGPNGSGKSLLARALAGQTPVAQGSLTFHLAEGEVAAHDLGGSYARRGQVVLVSLAQQQVLATRYAGYHQARWNSSESNHGPTVADLLSHHNVFAINPFEVLPEVRDHGAFDKRRDHAASRLGLVPLLGRPVRQLSDGEMRRLLLARALAAGPRLLILDDPFSGLDASGRAKLHEILDELAGGTTLVIATVRRAEVPASITHVIEVEGGQVLGKGPRKADAPTASPSRQSPGTRSRPVRDSTGESLVEMNGVTIRYGDAVILDDVTFTLRRGEQCALLGPNGAGKSTLLSLLLADNPQAYANDIRLFGRPRGSGESIWDIKARIGWVAPELLLHYPPGWSCIDVVLSGFFASLGLYQESGAEQRVQAGRTLAWLGLDSAAERPLCELPDGMQRMVLLARALVSIPDLLVLDEPCQGLDPEHTALVNRSVDRAARELGTSIIYVTHHEEELPGCITRVVRLENGRMLEE